jgi:hypothetical protein
MLLEQSTTRTMGYVGYIARMGETRGAYRVLVGKPEGDQLVHKIADGIILKLILQDSVGIE